MDWHHIGGLVWSSTSPDKTVYILTLGGGIYSPEWVLWSSDWGEVGRWSAALEGIVSAMRTASCKIIDHVGERA